MRDWRTDVGSTNRTKGSELTKDKLAHQHLKEAAEKAKVELSSAQATEVNLPFITADQNGPKHLVKAITRADLEQLVEDLIKRTLDPCKKALKDAGLKADAKIGRASCRERVCQYV